MALTPREEAELLMLLELDAQEKAKESLFKPQPGPQEVFLNTTADIAIYGGAAGGGKTYAILIEPIKHIDNAKFGAVVFRREAAQITTEGGLWDNAMELYPLKGAISKLSPRPSVIFPSGAKISFAHLQYEKDVHSWQGSQIPLICFDELTHFTRKQFFYMLSRNRSVCGVKPYMRATCNPDVDSWVAKFIEWWIDQDTGYPIAERSGVIRYFVVLEDVVHWADTPQELVDRLSTPAKPVKIEDAKSFTFIASSVHDNKILLEKDPGYLANLNAMGSVEKGRLLHGNWKIRASAGTYFPRAKAEIIPAVPKNQVVRWVRRWDLAATEISSSNPSPDKTAGVLMGKMKDGRFIIADARKAALKASDVRMLMKNTAATDKAAQGNVKIIVPQDPGQAGKDQAQSMVKMLAGYNVKAVRETGSKEVRAEPLAAQWQAGNVLIVAGDWNDAFLAEMELFPEGSHDDLCDAASGAFAELNNTSTIKLSPLLVKARW